MRPFGGVFSCCIKGAVRALSLIVVAVPITTTAATVVVGPQERISTIAEAAKIARDGDTVLITSGIYRGDVAVWQQKQLTIRGIGKRPVLIADGQIAEGKAIWVIRNGDFSLENLELRGARALSGNGAGIRFERGRLWVKNCVFRNNQTGILTGNNATSSLKIEDSLFADAPHQLHSLPHLVYVGRIASFEISGSRLENGFRGHLLKSRARRSSIRYNWIVDGPSGQASYEVDLPDGGDSLLLGNVIGQSARSENDAIVAYGAEHAFWAQNRLRISHNTMINGRGLSGTFIRIWRERLPPHTPISVRNNLLFGPARAQPSWLDPSLGNYLAAADDAAHPEDLESLRATTQSIAMKMNIAAQRAAPELVPRAEFSWPAGIAAVSPGPAPIAGAYQLGR